MVTDKARLFVCGENTKVWIPLVKLFVKPDPEDPDRYNECVTPKWVYMKTELPYYTEPSEFVVTSTVNEKRIENYGTFLTPDGCEAMSDDETMKYVLTKVTNNSYEQASCGDFYSCVLYFKEGSGWIRGNEVSNYSTISDFVSALRRASDFTKAYDTLRKEVVE